MPSMVGTFSDAVLTIFDTLKLFLLADHRFWLPQTLQAPVFKPSTAALMVVMRPHIRSYPTVFHA